MKKLWVKRAIIALITLFIMVIIAEFSVTALYPDLATVNEAVESETGLKIFAAPPTWTVTLKPLVSYSPHVSKSIGRSDRGRELPEFAYFISTNDAGFRGLKNIRQEKAPDTYRILFLGDSMTFGWGVGDDETYPAKVADLLSAALKSNPAIKKIEVINAGFADGFSPDSYYLYYRNRGRDFHPDLIVMNLFPYNDIEDVGSNEWLYPDETGSPQKVKSKALAVADEGYLINIANEKNMAYRYPVLRKFHLGTLLIRFFENKAAKGAAAFKHSEALACLTSINADQAGCSPETLDAVKKTEFIIGQLVKDVRADQKDAFVTIMSSLAYSEAAPHEYFSRSFAEAGIDYLDLLPAQKHPSMELDYYLKDGHLNPAGTSAIAAAIAKAITLRKPALFNKF